MIEFNPIEFPTKHRPIPVFPAVPSTIVPPFSICFFLIASFKISYSSDSGLLICVRTQPRDRLWLFQSFPEQVRKNANAKSRFETRISL